MGEKDPEILSLAECTALLASVAAVVGFQPQATTFKAYHHALRDVPGRLLQAACETAIKAPREQYEPRFPTAPQLRAWAEQARLAWLKANPWAPCVTCEESPGWVEIADAAGNHRLARCVCWKAYQERTAADGMRTQLALPPAPRPLRAREDAEVDA